MNARFENFKTEILTLLQNGLPEDQGHALNTLHWLIVLDPNSPETLRCAALAHDIERAVTPRISRIEGEALNLYKLRHAERSAIIAQPLLEACGYTLSEIHEICLLIRNHESELADSTVRDADTISFFDHNLPYYLARAGAEAGKQRISENLENASERAGNVIKQLGF